MANYTVPEALSFLPSTVWVEVFLDDPDDGRFHRWSCVRIVGVVLPLPGVYEHGHFLGFDLFNPDLYPCEYMWSDIVSILPATVRNGRRSSERANARLGVSERASEPRRSRD